MYVSDANPGYVGYIYFRASRICIFYYMYGSGSFHYS
jgi:hypothetical protein